MMKIKQMSMAVIAIVIVLPALYWIKCQMGIDVAKSLHINNFILNTLSSRIYAAESADFPHNPEVLFEDTFDAATTKNNWSEIWMREKDKVKQLYEYSGIDKSNVLMIESSSEKDWAYPHAMFIKVKETQIFSFEGYIINEGKRINSSFSVTIYDKDKRVIKWDYARENVYQSQDWTKVNRRFMIPSGVFYVRFRIAGAGVGKTRVDYIKFSKDENIDFFSKKDDTIFLENDYLRYSINFQKDTIEVYDKRKNSLWVATDALQSLFVLDAKIINSSLLNLKLLDPETLLQFEITAGISDNDSVSYQISQVNTGQFNRLAFPPKFVSDKKDMSVVLPVGEGMIIPVSSLPPLIPEELPAYQGHGGLSMPWFGVQQQDNVGYMAIIETPDDAKLSLKRGSDGYVSPQIVWEDSKGLYSYDRKVIYKFLSKGNYVDMAKYYRDYIKETGQLKTLIWKQQHGVPLLNRLIGAVDIWYFGIQEHEMIKEFLKSDFRKVLWSSHKTSIDINKKLNEYGYLSARYDNYQDVYPPGSPQPWKDGWPDGLALDRFNNRNVSWIDKRDNREYSAYQLCSLPAIEIAKKRLPSFIIADHYTAHLVDTITASPWFECYNPTHLTNRGSDRENKMKILMMSGSLGLVVGAEAGIYSAVPYVSYFEGILSLTPYRLKGGDEVRGYTPPTPEFLKYQVGPQYRVPLWELVFHDCVVNTWWWGDSNNKAPEAWHLKDLFNILYGTMPMWVIRDSQHFEQYKYRFIEGYQKVNPIFEKVGYSEMISHSFITSDHAVQKSLFSNGIEVYVNFGSQLYNLSDNIHISPFSFIVFEHDKLWTQGQFVPLPPPKSYINEQ